MADSEDQITLKKRARRRLVGAIALLTFIVIALPMVFDKESKPLSRDISVQIPNPDSSEFQHKLVPTPPSVPSSLPATSPPAVSGVAPTTTPAAPTPAPPAQVVQVPVTAPAAPKATPPLPKSAPEQTKPAVDNAKLPAAPAASAAPPAPGATAKSSPPKGGWMVKLGTYSDASNAKRFEAKLTSAKIKFHADPVDTEKGSGTRFWAGPYADRAAAENMRDKIRKAGFPDAVAAEK
jgi:DedD protein